MPKKIGDTFTLEIKDKYVEDGKSYGKNGGTVYAPDTDVMKASYTKYVFESATAFTAAVKAGKGKITCVIAGVGNSVETATQGAAPEGGFNNVTYLCTLGGSGAAAAGGGDAIRKRSRSRSSSSSSSDDE